MVDFKFGEIHDEPGTSFGARKEETAQNKNKKQTMKRETSQKDTGTVCRGSQ